MLKPCPGCGRKIRANKLMCGNCEHLARQLLMMRALVDMIALRELPEQIQRVGESMTKALRILLGQDSG
jgi:hypothetical protein